LIKNGKTEKPYPGSENGTVHRGEVLERDGGDVGRSWNGCSCAKTASKQGEEELSGVPGLYNAARQTRQKEHMVKSQGTISNERKGKNPVEVWVSIRRIVHQAGKAKLTKIRPREKGRRLV